MGVLGGAQGIPEIFPDCVSDKYIFLTFPSSGMNNFCADDALRDTDKWDISFSSFPHVDLPLTPKPLLMKLLFWTLGKGHEMFLLSLFFGTYAVCSFCILRHLSGDISLEGFTFNLVFSFELIAGISQIIFSLVLNSSPTFNKLMCVPEMPLTYMRLLNYVCVTSCNTSQSQAGIHDSVIGPFQHSLG